VIKLNVWTNVKIITISIINFPMIVCY